MWTKNTRLDLDTTAVHTMMTGRFIYIVVGRLCHVRVGGEGTKYNRILTNDIQR